MKKLLTKEMMAIVAIAMIAVLCTGSAQAQLPDWPEIFEPNRVITLHLTIDPCDWAFIVREVSPTDDPKTYTQFPAWFWANEDPNVILVSVRKKSCTLIPLPGYTIPGDANLIDPNKVKISLKVDTNKYVTGQDWHGLIKLSLENGGLTEGLAGNIHRIASAPEGYDYDAWHNSWVKVYVNGEYKGFYANAEQIDKRFMQNRDLYVWHETWLYKSWGSGALQLKVGDNNDPCSPTYQALCYRPFPCLDEDSPLYIGGGLCAAPNDIILEQQLNDLVNMKGMLALGVANAFLANHDSLFGANGHNFSMVDFDDGSGRKRTFFPWDTDAVFGDTNYDIYETGSTEDSYAGLIFGHPTFRSQYNQIIRDLLNGPLSLANLNAFIDDINTPELRAAIATDPWDVLGGEAGVAAYLDSMRLWFSERIDNMLAQIEFDEPTPPPGIILLQDGFEGDVWDANWTGTWVEDTSTYCRGASSAHAYKDNYGDFNCVALDTGDAAAVHVDFWLRMNNIVGSYNPKLYYYNGTSYVDVCDLDTFGPDDVWLHYTDTITDSNYFIPNFNIKFSATLGGGGPGRDVWVDDVIITKEMPEGTPCDAANLDGAGLVNFNDFVILADDWQLTGPGLAGDIDANDVVNFGDLDWMFDYWLDDCQP